MNIPKNGRIVVIDDEYEKEALPLIEALSKNGVSAMYFTGNQEKLPPEPLSGVRIVFLDIVLAGTEGQDNKTKISTIIGVLSKIIGKNNKSYLIIAWTKHNELIEGLKNNLKENPPIFILNLKKSECKDSQGNYEISKVEKKLKKELKKAGAFQLFVIWENLVHKSTGKIVNDFSSFYPMDDNWDSNMCGVFQKLARAYVGKQLNDGETDKLIKDALLTFNGTFLDTLENEISNKKIEGLKINDSNNVNNDITAQINSRLHLIIQPPKNSVPGNIYEWENQVNINDLFDGDINSCPQKDNFLMKLKYILLEVSPSCDYAQNKWKLHRVLHGLMWPENDFNKIKKKADYIYTSPIFKVDNKIYKFVFDLRYLTTLSLDELKDKKPVLRIRHDLLVDIQSKIAGHINRPGVICLEQNQN